jgi:CzcA family heavy metal efflux pump
MIDAVIRASLRNRLLVLAGALALAVYGGYRASQLPIDIFPDLNRPTVTVMTESHGLAPEEVETLVTFPIESAMNGANGVIRVRSASGIGLAIVWVEFDWGTDIYRARQVVAEKLQLVRERLPAGATPVMTPITSIMGEILLIGLRSPSGSTDPMTLRTLADWIVRPRLLGIGGVAQVTVMGGIMKQYQVLTSPEQLARHDVTLDELTRAVERSNRATGGGFLLKDDRESLIRILGRAGDADDLANTVVRAGDPVPITVRQVADVRLAGPVKRGEGSVNGRPAVILSVQKQPGADTLGLSERIDRTLAEIRATAPPGIEFDTDIFRQERFIDAAIDNVLEAIRDGTAWVVVVLFVFLWNVRVSLITLTALPLSVLVTALVFDHFGITVNTMTLGGLAVAIGELVDDSIVDAENIYRRLKENRTREQPDPPLAVIYAASMEIRHSIVYATLIVVLVVLPLFSLPGLEGRMFAPLGLSYLLTLLASLAVSLTVTPALASLVLPGARLLERPGDPWLLRNLKRLDMHLLHVTLRHATAVLVSVAVVVAVSVASLAWMGGEFLPAFNEGTLTVAATCPPGTSLLESDRLGTRVEALLRAIPEVTHVARRTGRAELDEHAENVNFSEIDVTLAEPERPLPGVHHAILRAVPGLRHLGVRRIGRDRAVVLAEIREALSEMPGVVFNIGQPISHRLDHIMSGINAQIAVKLFGPDLTVLREKAGEIARLMAGVPGVVDLQVEPQVDIPQVQVRVRREAAAAHGLAPGGVAEALETAFQGRVVSQVLEGQRTFDLVVWFDEASRGDVEAIRSTLVSTPSGARVALGSVAEVLQTTGPNTINREGVVRRIVVQANVAGRDLVGVVNTVRRAVTASVRPTLPPGYFVEYGGQFEAQRQANRRLLILGGVAILGVALLLYKALESWHAALQVLVNVPLAAIGSVLALLLAHWPGVSAFQGVSWWGWPRVWAGSVTLSVAHWVGFITLIGIVSRNGIMMISHYLHLMRYEGEPFGEAMIVRGSLERLAPVLMTALTAAIGLVPLALGAGQTGKELLHPLAVVVIGGLVSSTLLDQVVTPALFFKFGRGVYRGSSAPGAECQVSGEEQLTPA